MIIGMTWLLLGCSPTKPVQLHPAPDFSAERMAQIRAAQIRVQPMAMGSLIPRVLDILMDNGYLVWATNARLGTVSFSQQWQDPNQDNAKITMYGSLLFTVLGPDSTRIRLVLAGGAHRMELTGLGKDYRAFGQVSTAQQIADIDEHKKLLDLLEKALCKASSE
jgi:hypothetical protein